MFLNVAKNSAVIVGVNNWQRRLWTLVGEFVQASRAGPLPPFTEPDPLATDVRFQRERSRCVEAVSAPCARICNEGKGGMFPCLQNVHGFCLLNQKEKIEINIK